MSASNFATVKLNSGFVDEARREAKTLRRSTGSQIEHWARLGQALENAEGFTIARVRRALRGGMTLEDLAPAEQEALFDQLGDHFDTPSPAVRKRYAALGARPGAVGDAPQERLNGRPRGRARAAG